MKQTPCEPLCSEGVCFYPQNVNLTTEIDYRENVGKMAITGNIIPESLV